MAVAHKARAVSSVGQSASLTRRRSSVRAGYGPFSSSPSPHMRRILSALIVLALSSASLAQLIEIPSTGKSLPEETPQQHDARLAWWREARFGMFIHFGLYSVAAGEWNGVRTKGLGEWIMHDLK